MWHDFGIAIGGFVVGFGFAAFLNMMRDERRKKNWKSYTEDLERSER